jgi:hypothetical protein
VCCWGGTGGSLAIIDVDRRITFDYVMNKMAPLHLMGGQLNASFLENPKVPKGGFGDHYGALTQNFLDRVNASQCIK